MFAVGSVYPSSLHATASLMCFLVVTVFHGAWRNERHLRDQLLTSKRLEESQQEVMDQTVTITGMKVEIQVLEENIETARSAMQNQTGTIADMKSEIQVLEEDIETARSTMQQLASTIKIRLDESRALECNIQALRRELEEIEVEKQDNVMPLPMGIPRTYF